MGFKVASRVRGLSDEAFREAFGAEEQCRSALSRLRWPDGFVCPACGHRGHCVLAGRSLYQCYRCKKQTSSTAGTIFHATKLPLTLWFAAVHLIVTAKNGISSVELGRRLGVKQPTAWTMKHKIMAVMARREADTPLSGRVEMDDAYLGGARAGGKRGRGAPGKTPFVAAVSTSPEGRPRKVKLVPVKGFRKREIARGAKRWLAPGSEVLTDGLRCWNALDGVVGSHRAIRTGSGRQAALQMGQHDARQHQERDHRNLPQARPRSCPTLPRQLRLAIQPALPAQHHDPALRSQRRTNPTHPIPGAHRWMTFMDKQEKQFLEDIEARKLEGDIARLGKALLVFHAPRDSVVGIDNAARIFQAAKHPKSFVSLDDADHLLSRHADAIYVARVTAAWAERYLGPAPAGEAFAPPQAEPGEVVVAESVPGGLTQAISFGGRHEFTADEPASSGGADTGPSPYELLSAALGACTTMTLRMYAGRKNMALERASVRLRHDKIHAADCAECETREGRIDRIEREIELTGALSADERARLIEIADKCPVHRTLHSEVQVVTREREA